MAEDYQYDAFFSYKRYPQMRDWTRGVQGQFQFWLSLELGREAELFIDEDCIEVGTKWPKKLQEAVRRSRCMVGIWSPLYFTSSWCLSEWQSFRRREELLGLDTNGLVAPLRFHGGDKFPVEAKATQQVDISQYCSTLPGFWQSARALALEDILKAFAKSVAKMINSAPAFRPDWPVIQVPAQPAIHIDLEKL